MINHNTLTERFTQQAQRTPDNIAIVYNGKEITYRVLNERSNQLANFLKSNNVTEDTLVPICFSRSIEMIVGILGIIKAGGAYVPIDPEYPLDRISYIFKDTGSQLIITDNSSFLAIDALDNSKKIINIEDGWSIIAKQSVIAPEINLQPHNLAYIIYTSGSTGKPKGVMIEHRNVISLFSSTDALFSFDENDVWTMFHSFCFDFSVWEMYGALLYGGRLIIVPKNVTKNAAAFSSLILKERVTVLNQTPSAFYLLQDYILSNTTALPLRYVVFGGEALTPSRLKKWDAQFKDCELINMYGITETTVHVSFIKLTENHYNSSKSVIGRAIPSLYAYVLDNEQLKAPLATEGELYIGGEGLARGYLNLPELTNYRFIKDHFSKDEKARLYRTGDLAKILPDGSLEYLGRVDDQVKINGFRIELGEIENNINSFQGIIQCVVLAQENTVGEKRLIAYVQHTEEINKQRLLNHLQDKLPDYMVPRTFIDIESIPLTSNGKTDKAALSKIKLRRPDLTMLYKKSRTKTEGELSNIWASLLEIEKVGVDDNFFDLGGSSLMAQKVVAQFTSTVGHNLPVTKLYQYPTIAKLAGYIDGKNTQAFNRQKKDTDQAQSKDIAVIGLAGRFPGADTIAKLWELLVEGKETTSFFCDAELDPTIPAYLKNDPTYVKARGIINKAEYFDPAFFGITPKLAELMDPQQRIFLEIAWEVLEQTGHLPARYAKKVGVFAGVGTNTYYENNVLPQTDLIEDVGKLQVLSVNEKDYIASRTCYHLNLKGPGVSINSACSTSLLAISQAVSSLRTGQCDVAIAGGASITSPVKSGHLYQEGSMLSVDGHCRSFDDDATGTVFSDGAGVVLLKRLVDAKRDGDTIYAIIKGIGVNNDGFDKGSFTTPNSDGQADAISSAIIEAGIEAADITYIEAHGTGTPIGDPIEFEGLVTAFGNQDERQYCAISSIKSNFGHLTQAAGVAGLIKVCLSLYNKKLLPSVGYKKPNHQIDFLNSPFYVNNQFKDWEPGKKRLAGVSSFGVGGTNVHVVLEEYDNVAPVASPGRPYDLVTWSANSENSRNDFGTALGQYIQGEEDVALADVAYSLHRSRNDFNYRNFSVSKSAKELAILLTSGTSDSQNANQLKLRPGEVVFTFPGQGAQYVNMGADLYKHETVYKAAIDECATILSNYLDLDIRTVIYAGGLPDNEANERLKNTKFTQPALFVTEYALAKLWMSWGITPTLFCGHSIGEYVAAHLAGIFSLEDSLKLIATRGKLVSELTPGGMLSVREDWSSVEAYLTDNLSIAAINSFKLCVIAGPNDEIANLSALLTVREIPNKLLYTTHAFHSSMMDPILEDFKKVVSKISFLTPQIPIISTVSGNILTNKEAVDVDYWVNHLRNTVQFSKAIATALTYDNPIFLEVGPGNVTSTFVKQIASQHTSTAIKAIASLNSKENDYYTMLNALGKLWNNGLEPAWDNFYAGQQRIFLNLPSYQFDRKKYWVEPVANNNTPIADTIVKNSRSGNNIHCETADYRAADNFTMRKNELTLKVKKLLENASGIDLTNTGPDANFIEIGLDSLLLTQVAISLKRVFNLPITFRKLNEEYPTIETLVDYIDKNTPQTEYSAPVVARPAPVQSDQDANYFAVNDSGQIPTTQIGLIAKQLELLSLQMRLMQGTNIPASTQTAAVYTPLIQGNEAKKDIDDLTAEEKAEIKKPFGATPRIDRQVTLLAPHQVDFIKDLTAAYNKKTINSKAYAANARPFMADPRVVTGFKPATKEIVYPIVINKSSGSKLWDIERL